MRIVFIEVFSTKQGVNRAECIEVKICDYATGVGDLVSRTSDIMINSLIFPKHSRLMRLDAELTLGYDASCFGELPSENDSQSFSSVRHSADSRQLAWRLSIISLDGTQSGKG